MLLKMTLKDSGIVLNKPIYKGFDLYTTPMHPFRGGLQFCLIFTPIQRKQLEERE